MNYTTAILLVRSDIKVVAVSYEVNADGTGREPFVNYKTPDPDLKVGDFVIIPTDTRHRLTVARVEVLDVEIDPASATPVNWLVSSAIDRTAYDSLLSAEANVIAAIKSAETRRAREELASKLLADNPELKQFGTLNVAALEGPAPVTPPAAPYRDPPSEF